jgi:hypothetical protein
VSASHARAPKSPEFRSPDRGTPVALIRRRETKPTAAATRRLDMLKHIKYWLLIAPLMVAPLIPGCQILGE